MSSLTLVSIDGTVTRNVDSRSAHAAVIRAAVKSDVCRKIFDPATGEVLDVRTAVAVIHPDSFTVVAVCSPNAWRQNGHLLAESGRGHYLLWHRPM